MHFCTHTLANTETTLLMKHTVDIADYEIENWFSDTIIKVTPNKNDQTKGQKTDIAPLNVTFPGCLK